MCLSAGYYDAYYLKAQRVRTLIKNDFEEAFKQLRCDHHADSADDGIQNRRKDPRPAANVSFGYLHDLDQSGRLAGHSLPCGFDGDGMPIGLQIIGKHFDEATVLRTAYAYEQATEWHKKKPTL